MCNFMLVELHTYPSCLFSTEALLALRQKVGCSFAWPHRSLVNHNMNRTSFNLIWYIMLVSGNCFLSNSNYLICLLAAVLKKCHCLNLSALGFRRNFLYFYQRSKIQRTQHSTVDNFCIKATVQNIRPFIYDTRQDKKIAIHFCVWIPELQSLFKILTFAGK
jgi:hypothetical protein